MCAVLPFFVSSIPSSAGEGAFREKETEQERGTREEDMEGHAPGSGKEEREAGG